MGKLVEKPKIELDRVSVRDMDLKGTTLLFMVSVENSNKVDIKVDEIAYKIFINGREITTAKTEKSILIPAQKKSEVEIPLPIEYTKIWSNLTDIIMAKSALYRIEGNAKFPMFSIPFKNEGQIQVRRN